MMRLLTHTQTFQDKTCKKLKKFDDISNMMFCLSVGPRAKNVAKGIKDYAG